MPKGYLGHPDKVPYDKLGCEQVGSYVRLDKG